MTTILARLGADGERRDLARRVAEAEFDVIRVRQARIAMLQRPLVKEPPLEGPHSRTSDLKDLLRLVTEVLKPGGDPFRGEALRTPRRDMELPPKAEVVRSEPVGSDENDHVSAVIAERSSDLRRLDRYERRALSRRRKAIRALDNLGRSVGCQALPHNRAVAGT